MVSRRRLLLFLLFVSSFLKSFGINICPTRDTTLSSGYITSPNFPSKYDDNTNCTLTIRAPSGFTIHFTFTKLALEENCLDYVNISGISSKRFCNENTPLVFNPGGNVVTVQMHSDSSITRDGFRLQFVRKRNLADFGINICPTREITLSSGYITSPNYPNDYDNNINCTLTIRAPSGISFRFTFTKLDLERGIYGIDECHDYVKISGISSKRFCYENTPSVFNPGGNVVTVQMYSNSFLSRNGFRLQLMGNFSDAQGCSFEDGLGTKKCPWRNINYGGHAYDDFDWTVGFGSTNSYQGKYAYLETSSLRRGERAWLVSDYFKNSFTCFRFSYYVDDTSGGLLKVYQQTYGSEKRLKWTALPKSRVFKWFEVSITLPPTGGNSGYRIIVEGIKGSGYNIAVDEFTFVCSSTVCRSGSLMTSWPCMRNEETRDDFDWSIGSGISRNLSSGLSTDSKGSIYGNYFFIETSPLRKQGDKAWLVSRSFFNSRKCLTFHYYMYGNNIGSLNVYRQTDGLFRKSVWSKSGNHGNSWFKTQVYVDGFYDNTRIIIEGVGGSGLTGVIAVDNIELNDGFCNVQLITRLDSPTTVPTRQRTTSNKSHSTGNTAIILGVVGAVVFLLVISMLIIHYTRQKNRQRNSSNSTTQPSRIRNPTYLTTQPSSIRNPTYSTTQPESVQITTYSTTQPESVQITTYSTTQPESVQNKNYSTNQQSTLTSLPPPSYESVCDLPPSYSHAAGVASVGDYENIVPTTNSGQNGHTVPMSNNISGDNPNPNSNPEEIVGDINAEENVYETLLQ
ncbi:uncharacterized protein LOC124449410 isoform X2 [Xenia sp. Carnegie-2017]|uniref:uncharacterized protein LOC124449410 isoform X2 n=1 Tax=Xenia sp. Carnegie-2017 TaxID=2897299 RepID=UPI001F04C9D6|nr:uncharacterized protein LOC124449410 isoform X2 [Xenia sp. Carnegie-2017]